MDTDYYLGMLLFAACFLVVAILFTFAALAPPPGGDPFRLFGNLWIAGFAYLFGGIFIVLGLRSYLKERAAAPGAKPMEPPFL